MKSNRQNTFASYRQNQLPLKLDHNHFKSKNRSMQQTKYRLVDLIGQHSHQLIVLNCHQNITVSLTKLQKSRMNNLNEYGSIKDDNQIYIKADVGSVNLLKQCFSAFQANSYKDYIFNATMIHSRAHHKMGVKPKSESKPYYSSKTASISTKYLSQRRPSTTRPSIAPFSTSNIGKILESEAENNKSRYFSNKKIQEAKQQQMFTVQEIGQSIQSQLKEVKQSTEANKCFQKGLAQLENNKYKDSLCHKCPETISKLNFNSSIELQQPQKSLSSENKENLKNSNFNKMVEPLMNAAPSIAQITQSTANNRKSIVKNERKEISITDKTDSKEQSFGTKMRKGLIDYQFPSNNWMSFKVAGDAQIQCYKLKLKQEVQASAYQMSDISELSSIGSNNLKEQLYKKDNSIKSQLEDINNCLKKSEKTYQAPLFGRVQLNLCPKSQITYEMIKTNQISNNTDLKPTTNELPLRYMQNKSTFIPLRFRKKQQMMHQLLKANIIERQSNSINIP